PTWPSKKKSIVMKKVIVFGCFDPLHEGHRNFFSQAKKLGDYLVVAVARDSNIRHYKNHEPSRLEAERLRAVSSLDEVDEAMLGDESGEYKVLEKVKPDIIAI